MYVTVTSSHPHQAPHSSQYRLFTLTPIFAKRGDTEMERRIAHAHLTAYSLICLLHTEYYACFEWEGSPAKLVLAHGKIFHFIETIKLVLTGERGRKKRAFA